MTGKHKRRPVSWMEAGRRSYQQTYNLLLGGGPMNLRMFFHYLCVLFCLFTCSFFMVLTSFAQEQDDVETVRYLNFDIPVVESNRPLITGLKIESFLKEYIPDLEDFEYELVGGFNGIVARGRVKPDPNDPETRFCYGKKRKLPFYKRRWKISLGIFRSHRDALLAAVRSLSMVNMPVPVAPLEKENPGFVFWHEGKYVIDNVLAGFEGSKEMDAKRIQNALKRELIDGAEWVIKGGKPIPPIIHGEDFPAKFTLQTSGIAAATLQVYDPNLRKFYRRISPFTFGKEKEYPERFTDDGIEAFSAPIVEWGPSGDVQLHLKEFTVFDLKAVAVNDLCVVSDLWIKKDVQCYVLTKQANP